MMISTKGRYAIRLMLDLAQHMGDGFVSLKRISERQDISVKYLEAIVAMLNKAGMVESSRGKEGGYRLARTPEEYTVGSIIRLTEGSIAPVVCLECGAGRCERAADCLSLPVWVKLESVVNNYLDSVTLRDLLDGKV